MGDWFFCEPYSSGGSCCLFKRSRIKSEEFGKTENPEELRVMELKSRILDRLSTKREQKWMALSATILIGLLTAYFLLFSPEPLPPTTDLTGPIGSPSKESHYQVIEGRVKEKSTLFKSLMEQNIPLHWIELIISKLKPYLNFKRIKGGTYRIFSDVKGRLVRFIFEAGPTEVYEIEKDSQGYTAQRREVFLETQWVKVVGEIRSSLFEAMDAIGEQDQLAIAFAEILAWEIDFYKDVREGDRFKLLVEKAYKGDQFIQYGPIHAVEYQRGEKKIRGIRYQGEYYNENGVSLKKAFLKAPLRFNRISSRFSRARRHPILGGVRPHFGVDYAAPTGTPIWAVADGRILSCGWNGGFGNQVVLRHPNGYTTFYGHLSRYGPGIRRGARVRQKQIIGYVGSTGLATGPHLDYRLVKGGRFRNPLKESFPAGLPIRRGELEGFEKRRDEMIAGLEGDTPFYKRMEEVIGLSQDGLGRVHSVRNRGTF
jgi:murein DD-endopeptidase MepM/ murein hydrolase activator NlpD